VNWYVWSSQGITGTRQQQVRGNVTKVTPVEGLDPARKSTRSRPVDR
jgi:hypothetical protein